MACKRNDESRGAHSHTYTHRRRARAAQKCRTRRALIVSAVCVVLVCAITLGLGFGVWGWGGVGVPASSSQPLVPSSTSVAPPAPSQSVSIPEPQPVEHRLRFSAAGDNLIHEAIYTSAANKAGGEGYDFTYCYENVADFFSGFDVNWINQETLINDEFPASTYPAFSTPGAMGHTLYDAGWRVFALSNNHTYDKEYAGTTGGVNATVKFWDSMPDDVVTTGLFTSRTDDSGIGLHEVNGITIAYVAFTESTNGIPPHAGLESFVIYTTNLYSDEDRAAMEFKVRRAKELADVVVVSAHWGVEYSHTPTAGQRSLAAEFAEWGADVVIGTHPHVIQPVEIIETSDGRQVPVAYSLGNFLSAQNEPPRMVGLCFTFEISLWEDPDGTRHAPQIENVKVYPTVTQYEYRGGRFYEDSRAYMYRDYTDELAAQHGVPGGMSRAYIQNLTQQVVSEEFLVLD